MKTSNQTLSAPARSKIRKAIRNHPDKDLFVTDGQNINTMDKDTLLSIAESIGIECETDTKTTKPETDTSPFTGTVEFPVHYKVLGQAIERIARVEYWLTPSWEYWDVATATPKRGLMSQRTNPTIGYMAETMIVSKDRRTKATERRWVQSDETSLLSSREVDAAIDDLIDKACRSEDKQRRTVSASLL